MAPDNFVQDRLNVVSEVPQPSQSPPGIAMANHNGPTSNFCENCGAPDTKGGPGGTVLDAAIADAIVGL